MLRVRPVGHRAGLSLLRRRSGDLPVAAAAAPRQSIADLTNDSLHIPGLRPVRAGVPAVSQVFVAARTLAGGSTGSPSSGSGSGRRPLPACSSCPPGLRSAESSRVEQSRSRLRHSALHRCRAAIGSFDGDVPESVLSIHPRPPLQLRDPQLQPRIRRPQPRQLLLPSLRLGVFSGQRLPQPRVGLTQRRSGRASRHIGHNTNTISNQRRDQLSRPGVSPIRIHPGRPTPVNAHGRWVGLVYRKRPGYTVGGSRRNVEQASNAWAATSSTLYVPRQLSSKWTRGSRTDWLPLGLPARWNIISQSFIAGTSDSRPRISTVRYSTLPPAFPAFVRVRSRTMTCLFWATSSLTRCGGR